MASSSNRLGLNGLCSSSSWRAASLALFIGTAAGPLLMLFRHAG